MNLHDQALKASEKVFRTREPNPGFGTKLTREMFCDTVSDSFFNGVEGGTRWICCQDRLPKHGEKVLAYSGGDWLEPEYRSYHIAIYKNEWLTGELFEYSIDGEITHWMPLPEPPALEV